MNNSRGHFRPGLKLFFAVAIVWTSSNVTAADVYVPFEGEKATWHEGFDRYDFIMDDATGAITPMTAPASEVTSFGIDESVKDGKRRCVVIVPKKAAPGNPWSWRMLLEPPASNRGRATETRFSHRLCGARSGQTGQ